MRDHPLVLSIVSYFFHQYFRLFRAWRHACPTIYNWNCLLFIVFVMEGLSLKALMQWCFRWKSMVPRTYIGTHVKQFWDKANPSSRPSLRHYLPKRFSKTWALLGASCLGLNHSCFSPKWCHVGDTSLKLPFLRLGPSPRDMQSNLHLSTIRIAPLCEPPSKMLIKYHNWWAMRIFAYIYIWWDDHARLTDGRNN